MMSHQKKRRALALGIALCLTAGLSVCAAASSGHPQAVPAAQSGQMPPPPPKDGSLPPGPPPDGMMGGPGQGGPGGQEGKDASELSAACVVDGETKELSRLHLTASAADENAVLARGGGSLTLTDSTLQKTGNSSSADASNFTGQNAIILASNSTLHLKNLDLSSDADGANAIFSTGEKSVVTAEHIKIHTKNDSSRGLDSTYGGTITASDVDITTEGAHCAALATDRGEGTVTVTGGTFHTAGDGSPCVYSTGSISVSDSRGEATGSEIAVVEGKNSITLDNVDFTGHAKHGVMLYQSFSGDADVGEASFAAKDSTLQNRSGGPMFYVTNTQASATLEHTQLIQDGDVLINVTSDRWGNAGSNGGNFTFYGKRQELAGNVLANAISTVAFRLTEGSRWTGAINPDRQAGTAVISLDKSSTWTLTADSYVTSLADEDGTYSNIASNGHAIYYDSAQNPSLGGRTIALPGGGKIAPMK